MRSVRAGSPPRTPPSPAAWGVAAPPRRPHEAGRPYCPLEGPALHRSAHGTSSALRDAATCEACSAPQPPRRRRVGRRAPPPAGDPGRRSGPGAWARRARGPCGVRRSTGGGPQFRQVCRFAGSVMKQSAQTGRPSSSRVTVRGRRARAPSMGDPVRPAWGVRPGGLGSDGVAADRPAGPGRRRRAGGDQRRSGGGAGTGLARGRGAGPERAGGDRSGRHPGDRALGQGRRDADLEEASGSIRCSGLSTTARSITAPAELGSLSRSCCDRAGRARTPPSTMSRCSTPRCGPDPGRATHPGPSGGRSRRTARQRRAR